MQKNFVDARHITKNSILWSILVTSVVVLAMVLINMETGLTLGFLLAFYEIKRLSFFQLLNADETNVALNSITSKGVSTGNESIEEIRLRLDEIEEKLEI